MEYHRPESKVDPAKQPAKTEAEHVSDTQSGHDETNQEVPNYSNIPQNTVSKDVITSATRR